MVRSMRWDRQTLIAFAGLPFALWTPRTQRRVGLGTGRGLSWHLDLGWRSGTCLLWCYEVRWQSRAFETDRDGKDNDSKDGKKPKP